MPVYSNLASSYGSLQIGDRIRRERKRHGWTLNELAGRFGVSVASLSAIENDKSPLTVDRLLELSAILRVRPDALFSGTRTRHFHVTRRTDVDSVRPPFAHVDRGGHAEWSYTNEVRPLAAPFVGKRIEPFEITILPAPDAAARFISHHHEEFFCVLEGVVECLLDAPDQRVRERLGPGDCMYFRSHLPHWLRAVGDRAARTVHVLCSPPGDSDDDRIDGDPGPIFRDGSANRLRPQLASKLRRLRQRHGLSLAQAADALAISPRRLAAIERATRPVGLDLLLRTCTVFRKPVEYFLASALIGPPFYVVQRARGIGRLRARHRRPSGRGPESGNVFKSLAGRFGARAMYPYYVRISPESTRVATLHEHHGQEFVYVLNGEVTLVTLVGGVRTTETLTRGDACFVDATVPHRFVAARSGPYGRTGADVLDVFWCPLGEDYLFRP